MINAGERINTAALHFAPERAGAFEIDYTITAQELPEPVRGTFGVTVRER